MSKELVAGLHDVGKLLQKKDEGPTKKSKDKLEDGTPVGSSHSFEGVNFSVFTEPKILSWLGIRYHMCLGGEIKLNDPNFLPNSSLEEKKALFLLVIADHLASSFSRVLRETSGENVSKKVYSLWREKEDKEPKLITNKEDLKELFDFLNSDPGFEKYKDKYELHLVPEEAEKPRNITSLLTHSQLVEQIYQVLKGCILLSGTRLIYDGDETGAETIKEAENNWKFRFVQSRIRFHQYLGRVVDLNLFKILEDAFEEFREETPNNLLFFTLDSFELFAPSEKFFNLRESLKPFLDKGFYLELKILNSTLSKLRHENIFRLLSDPKDPDFTYKIFYPDDILKPSFPPQLCEVCQMRQATEDWPPLDPVEKICSNCKKIRMAHPESRWRKFAKWEEEDVNVAWVKLSLERKRLDGILFRLFKKYCHKTSVRDIDKAVNDFRLLAVTRDFVDEYKRFLEEFEKKLTEVFPRTGDDYQCETISAQAKELYAVKIKSRNQIIEILKIFYELYKCYFPACEEWSPVKIGISVSSPKYPYFRHWQSLSDERDSSVYINLVEKGEISTEVSHLEEILIRAKEFDQQGKTSLHNLAEVAKLSESLATFVMKEHPLSNLLPMGLRYSEILTLSKILGD